jgi:hypothetical protein
MRGTGTGREIGTEGDREWEVAECECDMYTCVKLHCSIGIVPYSIGT